MTLELTPQEKAAWATNTGILLAIPLHWKLIHDDAWIIDEPTGFVRPGRTSTPFEYDVVIGTLFPATTNAFLVDLYSALRSSKLDEPEQLLLWNYYLGDYFWRWAVDSYWCKLRSTFMDTREQPEADRKVLLTKAMRSAKVTATRIKNNDPKVIDYRIRRYGAMSKDEQRTFLNNWIGDDTVRALANSRDTRRDRAVKFWKGRNPDRTPQTTLDLTLKKAAEPTPPAVPVDSSWVPAMPGSE